ncbi:nidogen-2 [Paramuricea clavata]|uniref:Nidogen-2 n=1 Tax=Paramuricea clavata TaxID=317549 RepID=A0A7D9I7S8_PARCT|nr:nidogen-2 [Paramuricea clavata]
MIEMNIGLILRIFPVLLLAYFASCRRTRQINEASNEGRNSTVPNEVGREVGNSVEQKPCHRHLKRVESFMFPSKFRPFIPLCDSNGYYLPLQCHQSSRYCWCVDKNGNMKPGTRTKGAINCGMKALKKPCESHRLRSLKHQANSFRSVFIPKCGDDGYYAPMQCTVKNKYCWCVDKDGNKKKGSRTKGLADCSGQKPKDKGN